MDFKKHIKRHGIKVYKRGSISKYYYKNNYYILNDLLNYNVKAITLGEFNNVYTKDYEIDLFLFLFIKLIEKNRILKKEKGKYEKRGCSKKIHKKNR